METLTIEQRKQKLSEFKQNLSNRLAERAAALQAQLNAEKAEQRKQRLYALGYSEYCDINIEDYE